MFPEHASNRAAVLSTALLLFVPLSSFPPAPEAQLPARQEQEVTCIPSNLGLDCPEYTSQSQFVGELLNGRILPSRLSQCFPLDADAQLKKDASAPVSPERYEALIRRLGLFSWQTFISLNWPVERQQGVFKLGEQLSSPGLPRWYYWSTADDLFAKGGPGEWGCHDESSAPRVLSNIHQATSQGLLYDQNQELVRYETTVNDKLYETIVTNHLYTQQGQSKLGRVTYPWGTTKNNKLQTPRAGSMAIKLAWKVLGPSEERKRFFTKEASSLDSQGGLEKHTFGLVGMHISYKASLFPTKWTFMSFEHVDNTRAPDSSAQANAEQSQPKPLFNNPDCPSTTCSPNDPASPDHKTQVVREVSLLSPMVTLNQEVRALLRDKAPESPTQYYHLVASQTGEQQPPGSQKAQTYIPDSGTNTVLETFIQLPQPTNSCMSCHSSAPLWQEEAPGKYQQVDGLGDFVFLLATGAKDETHQNDKP